MGRQISYPGTALDARKETGLGLSLRRILLVGGLGAMITVPLFALDDQRPAALGWQMYAGAVDLPAVSVVFPDGSQEERSIGNIASGFRPEIDYFEPVARFVCSSEQDAMAVELKRQRPVREEVFKCAQF